MGWVVYSERYKSGKNIAIDGVLVCLGRYKLECPRCGSIQEDEGYRLRCGQDHPGLLRTRYESEQIRFRDDMPGLFRYIDWLPVREPLPVDSISVTYKSQALASELGLKELYILFNGYWPEIGARMETCTFKELEAPPTIARLKGVGGGVLVLASAGNTARAFGWISSFPPKTRHSLPTVKGITARWYRYSPDPIR